MKLKNDIKEKKNMTMERSYSMWKHSDYICMYGPGSPKYMKQKVAEVRR